MLEIKNLYAKIRDTETEILHDLSLKVTKGETAAIMGPNGAGKSTLSYIIAGHDDYEITSGDILFNNESILDLEPSDRAALGIFLAFQYPLEIPGLATLEFLKVAINSQRKKRGETALPTAEFITKIKALSAELQIDMAMLKRPLNVGFSGGEKKRLEMFQMKLLNPSLGILDETDSGLDIDALKIVSKTVNSLRGADTSFLIITHYQRLLNYIVPDTVHIMYKGRIIKTGDKDLAQYLEKHGYASFINEVN